MLREQAKNGMVVRFGRPNGKKTLAKIKGCTGPCAASLVLLEQRGAGKGCEPGSKWRVGWSMIEPAEADGSSLQHGWPFSGFLNNAPTVAPPSSGSMGLVVK